MITVGTLAKMYGQLPSVVKANATTYDLMVANVTTSWENQKIDELNGKPKPPPKMSREQMEEMIKSVRG